MLASIAALSGTAAAACSEQIEAPPPRVPPTPEAHVLEQRMFVLVNRDRAQHGKPPLGYDETLADVARAHAADMHEHHFFAHESPTTGSLDDRLSRARISVATARENLAEAASVEQAQDSLMKSPGHFENLMAEDVTHVGIGVVAGGADHKEMSLFVQVFARRVVQEEPERAKAIALAKITEARRARGLPPPRLSPVLEALAGKLVAGVSDEMGRGSLDEVGAQVLAELKARNAPNLTVLVSGQRMVAASEYEPSQALLERATIEIGIGAAPAKDDKGRPAVKILVLVGGS